jgi:hypothetical protein
MRHNERHGRTAARSRATDLPRDIELGLEAGELKPCSICNRGVMHNGHVIFYELQLRPHVVDMHAVRQMHGFETMLAGAEPHGHVLAASTIISQRISKPAHRLVCMSCAVDKPAYISQLIED